ncbi:MAG: hypothetical protein JXR18_01065 [Neptuniibacter sp.]
MKRIALLLFISCTVSASDSSYFGKLGVMVSNNCEARSQDVKTAVHMRDKGVTKEEILKKLQRPNETWSIGSYFVDQIFQLNDKSPENFYQFSLHTCKVHYWKLVQDEACPIIFPEDKGTNCLKAAARTSKDMMINSFKHLSNS